MTAPLLFSLIASMLATAPPIVIDGAFDDWNDVAITLVDPADAPDAPLDLGTVRVSHDDRFVHLQFGIRRPANLQRLNGRIEVLFDADAGDESGGTAHGMAGVDLIVELSPLDPEHPGRAGIGAGIAFVNRAAPPADRVRMSPYLVGLTIAPTYAAEEFEMRIERGVEFPGVSPLFTSGSFRGRLVYLGRSGEVLDETEVFSHDLAPVDPVPPDRRADPLARPANTHLRVVTWNTGMNGLRSKPAVYARLLRALDPDVILFQELTEDDDPAELAARLGRWTVLIGRGGGRLRCAVAARRGLAAYGPMDPLPMPDRADRSVRVMGAELTVSGRRLLVASVHLRCCGYAGSFEDRTRIVEADAIHRAVAAAVETGRFDGVIIGGDLNLVGSRWPLDVLAEGLEIVEAVQLDGRSNTTWWDLRQPFVPGRLDFVMLSRASPSIRGSFVLDTRLVDPLWLKRHGLAAGDTVEASDHQPVVVDLGGLEPRR